MASSASPQRASAGGSAGVILPSLHLGSFSRMDIADFDSRGRYPTTPSQQVDLHRRDLSTQWPASPENISYQNTYTVSPISKSITSPPAAPKDHRREPSIPSPDTQKQPSVYFDPEEGGNEQQQQQQTSLNDPDDAPADLPQGAALPLPQDPNQVDQERGEGASITRPVSLVIGPRHPQVPTSANANGPPSSTLQNRSSLKATSPAVYSPSGLPPGAAPPTNRNSPNPAQRSPNPNSPSYSQQPYPSMYPQPMLTVQTSRKPTQPQPVVEEVCVECMMRDRDMADVDVTSPGVWERESDVQLRELVEREKEEEKAWYEEHSGELTQPGHNLKPPRKLSKGHRLTEQNLKLWLTMVSVRQIGGYAEIRYPFFFCRTRKNLMHE